MGKGNLAILIPAAGASSRMRGGDKLLELVDGVPVLARQAAMALSTGNPVMITLPAGHDARRKTLKALACDRLHIVQLENAAEGMAVSLRAGALWAQKQHTSGLMIMLADMPELNAEDLTRLRVSFENTPDQVVRAATHQGTPGHPVIFPARLYGAFGRLVGDKGAKEVLVGEDVSLVELPDQRALVDLDTPEEWANWRQDKQRQRD